VFGELTFIDNACSLALARQARPPLKIMIARCGRRFVRGGDFGDS